MSSPDSSEIRFGVPVKNQQDSNPKLYNRVRNHLGKEYLDYTPGQICSSVDVDFGQPDPRVLAGRQAIGDFTAKGGSGPKKK